jgi:hypothetical protein
MTSSYNVRNIEPVTTQTGGCDEFNTTTRLAKPRLGKFKAQSELR